MIQKTFIAYSLPTVVSNRVVSHSSILYILYGCTYVCAYLTDSTNGKTLLGSIDYTLIFAYAAGLFVRCVYVCVFASAGRY